MRETVMCKHEVEVDVVLNAQSRTRRWQLSDWPRAELESFENDLSSTSTQTILAFHFGET